MGWQLVPTGIGWREFSRTVEQGKFECSNPKCKGRKEVQQNYDLKNGRNWFTVLFVPIIPLNSTGSWAKCTSCKTVHPLSAVRAGTQRTAAAGQTAAPTPAPVTPSPPEVSEPASHPLGAPGSPARAQMPASPGPAPSGSAASSPSPTIPATQSPSSALSNVPVEAWLLAAGLLMYLIADIDEVYVLGAAGATWRKVVVLAGLIAAAVFGLGRRVMAGAVASASALFLLLRGAQVLVSGRGEWHRFPLLLGDVALAVGLHRCVSGFGQRADSDEPPIPQAAVFAAAGVAGLFGLLMFRDRLSDSFRFVFLEAAHWVGLAVVIALLILKIGTRPALVTAGLGAAYAAFALPSFDQLGGIRHVTMLALMALAGVAGFMLVKLGEQATPAAGLAEPATAYAMDGAASAPSSAPAVSSTSQPSPQASAGDAPLEAEGGLIAAVPGAIAPPAKRQPQAEPATADTAPRPDVVWADGRPLAVDNLVVIGRDPAATDADGPHVAVPVAGDGLVSKTHLAIGRSDDGSLWVEDRHSTNGVIVGESVLPPGGRVPLEPGDEVRFGDQIVRVLQAPGAGADTIPRPPGGADQPLVVADIPAPATAPADLQASSLSRWELVLAAAESSVTLANTDRFTSALGDLLRAYASEIQSALKPDDVPILVFPARLQIDGRAQMSIALLLHDRLLALWSTGIVRLKQQTLEIEYRTVTSVSTPDADSLMPHAPGATQLGGFSNSVPIFKDLVAAALQGRFAYDVGASGYLSQLTFDDLGITLNYDD